MVDFFDCVPPVAPTFRFVPEDAGLLSRWRDNSAPSWRDREFVAALRATVTVVRPLARELSAALHDCDASRAIGSVLKTEHEVRDVVDSLATDLLASALLLEALAGNVGAQVAVDHLRRRRRLPQVAWRKVVRSSRVSEDADDPTPLGA